MLPVTTDSSPSASRPVFNCILGYAALAGGICAWWLLRPYGSPEFAFLRYWPILSALIFGGFVLATQLSMPRGQLVLLAIIFISSAAISSISNEKNHLFLSQCSGSITRKYESDHELYALELKTADGRFYHVEGVEKPLYEAAAEGVSVQKHPRSFQVSVGGTTATISSWGKIVLDPASR
jgi:hypothetical protein